MGRGTITGRGRGRPTEPPGLRRRRAPAVLLAVVAAVLAAHAVAGAGGTAAASPTPASVVGGFPPTMATSTDANPDDFQQGFDVDRLGNTYLATDDALVSMRSAGGALVRTVAAQGPGTARPRGVAVSDVDLSVTVVGNVVGTVTVGTPPSQVTLDGGSLAQFLVQFDRDGYVRWARTFGGENLDIWGLHLVQLPPGPFEGDERLLVHGRYVGSVEIDGIEAAPSPDGEAGILGSFAADGGTADWLTSINLTAPEDLDYPLVHPQGAAVDADGGRFATVAFVGGAAQVRGPTTTFDLPCDAAGSGCSALVAVDPGTGEPRLARSLGHGTEIALDSVDVAATGYVVAGSVPDPAPGTQDPFIRRLDDDGGLVWEQVLGGDAWIKTVAFDSTGGVVAAATANSDLVLGTAPGAATVPLAGTADLVVVELTGAGAFTRWTHAGGAATATRTSDQPPTLRLTPDDRMFVTGDHHGPVTVGTGPGAIALPGSGSFLASFAPDAPPAGSSYVPLDPVRVLDSRTQTGSWGSPLVAGASREVEVGGVPGIPEGATAVVLNLTATDVSAMTYLAAWPTGGERPTASALNADAGQTIANHVTVPLGASGRVTLATAAGSANVVVDVLGVFVPETTHGRYHPVEPTRVVDTRIGLGWNAKLPAGGGFPLQVAGPGIVPAGATAVVLSLTATDVTQDTFLEVHAADTGDQGSNLNLLAGETRTNLVTTRVAPDGSIEIVNDSGSVDVVVDVVGYYATGTGGALFRPLAPTRVLDSRFAAGGSSTPWGPGTTRTVPVGHVVPGGSAAAVATNLTVTDTSSISFATLFAEPPRPATSNLLFDQGWTVAVAVNSGVAAEGTVSLFNQLGTANFVLDVSGYFAAP